MSGQNAACDLAGVVPEHCRYVHVTKTLELSRTPFTVAAFVLKVQLLSQRALHVLANRVRGARYDTTVYHSTTTLGLNLGLALKVILAVTLLKTLICT